MQEQQILFFFLPSPLPRNYPRHLHREEFWTDEIEKVARFEGSGFEVFRPWKDNAVRDQDTTQRKNEERGARGRIMAEGSPT